LDDIEGSLRTMLYANRAVLWLNGKSYIRDRRSVGQVPIQRPTVNNN